ncbi:MAG: NADPH:quinone reductase [Brevinematales bacterium]|jgi:NADPH2:quinone reductase
MKAIVVHEFGGPDVLKYEDTAVPEIPDGHVLVKVKASGVNPADTYARTGNYIMKPVLPYTPGTDGAGVIEKTGKGVSKYREGDRVYIGRSVSGTYAEYALAMENQVHCLPDNVTFSQGAGVFVPYGTAFHALSHAAMARKGEAVLIHGASGGVGTAAVQIAVSMGLKVFGTAGTQKGLELVKAQGAEKVFDHSREGYLEEIVKSTGGAGVDIILEMLANINLGHDLKILAMKGRVVVIGSRGDTVVTPRDLMGKRGTVTGIMLWNITREEAGEIHDYLYKGLLEGFLKPVVRAELPLKDADRAHIEVMSPGAMGKIVLIP